MAKSMRKLAIQQHRNICKSIISEHHHSPCNSSLQALPLCSYHCECFKNRQTPQHRFCAAFLINFCIRSEWFCVAPASLSSKENNLKIAVDQKKKSSSPFLLLLPLLMAPTAFWLQVAFRARAGEYIESKKHAEETALGS